PKDRIALRPCRPRDAARMLVVQGNALADHGVRDLPRFLSADDVLVFNDTRVIPARLIGRRGAAKIELTLLKAEGPLTWSALAKPAKKLRPGDTLTFGALEAQVAEKRQAGEVAVVFHCEADTLPELLVENGLMPLPPYIAGARGVDARDREDYQTVFAARDGAVAAPTAGLHFTDALLSAIGETGAKLAGVTLHVGAGTFLPVKAEDTEEHKMHAEWGEISEATAAELNTARAGGGRIFAIGTTSLRLLESAADANGAIRPFRGETDIFITPGYRFRATDALLTNFHLPRSTLFMLVAAFSGLAAMRTAYDHAIEAGYRFYSYGDACLLFPAREATA
ncbi:MAG: tRNA preQ1(34) S-adenosylmethionine ribosyltransferase-isomerase QueA, partial [Sphingomonadales bacterium]|nr:tRNA preQ1(34) S-adenosylmethionine ribosyltransferase-isomerase QueA [Sphingomonadales bacterium]